MTTDFVLYMDIICLKIVYFYATRVKELIRNNILKQVSFLLQTADLLFKAAVVQPHCVLFSFFGTFSKWNECINDVYFFP